MFDVSVGWGCHESKPLLFCRFGVDKAGQKRSSDTRKLTRHFIQIPCNFKPRCFACKRVPPQLSIFVFGVICLHFHLRLQRMWLWWQCVRQTEGERNGGWGMERMYHDDKDQQHSSNAVVKVRSLIPQSMSIWLHSGSDFYDWALPLPLLRCSMVLDRRLFPSFPCHFLLRPSADWWQPNQLNIIETLIILSCEVYNFKGSNVCIMHSLFFSHILILIMSLCPSCSEALSMWGSKIILLPSENEQSVMYFQKSKPTSV